MKKIASSIALLLVLALGACDDDGSTLPDGATPDGAASDGPAPDGQPNQPTLTCAPATAAEGELCGCMADIVCDQIYACLTPAQLAAKPASWSPKASCVAALVEDCDEDLASDPDSNLPADFRMCISDLAAATCGELGTFDSVANDFPASCENLRALDTALGIAP